MNATKIEDIYHVQTLFRKIRIYNHRIKPKNCADLLVLF